MRLGSWKRVTARLRDDSGFSLLELMIVLLVFAVLLAMAVPSYQRYAQRAERAEAVRLLLATAACQERLRADTGYYDTSACLEGAGSDHYSIRAEPVGQAALLAYRLVAEPVHSREDDPCGSLSLDQAGTRGISGAADALAGCWSGR